MLAALAFAAERSADGAGSLWLRSSFLWPGGGGCGCCCCCCCCSLMLSRISVLTELTKEVTLMRSDVTGFELRLLIVWCWKAAPVEDPRTGEPTALWLVSNPHRKTFWCCCCCKLLMLFWLLVVLLCALLLLLLLPWFWKYKEKDKLLSLVIKHHACQCSCNCQAWRNNPPSVLPPSSPRSILLATALWNHSPSMLMLIWCMCVIKSYHTCTVPDSTRVLPQTSLNKILTDFVYQATPWLRQSAVRISPSSNLGPSKWDLWCQVVWEMRFKWHLKFVCPWWLASCHSSGPF